MAATCTGNMLCAACLIYVFALNSHTLSLFANVSFGHSEYNQHGDRTGAHHDYAEAHYYFVPRRVNITRTQASGAAYQRTGGRWSSAASATPERVHVKRVSCGACFTLAIDLHGDLYSWGWNESGVLGHGVRHFASSPLRIPSIGANFDGCKVRAVHAGGNHVAALTDSQGNAWASSFHSILESNNHADCMICIDDKISEVAAKFAPTGKKKSSGAKQGPFLCHRAILAARSTFLRGFIQAALREAQGTDEVYSTRILAITLPSDHANAVTVKSLLDYLYMDRIHIAGHKRQELALLATDLHLERLATILSADADSAPQLTRSLASTFTENLVNLSHSAAHSDVVFVVPKDHSKQKFYGEDGRDRVLRVFDPEEHEFVSYGHLVVVGSRLPYFEVLLSSGFSESHNTVLIRAPFSGTMSKAVQIDVSGLVLEGIELATFEMVLLYAYTGQLRAQTGKNLVYRCFCVSVTFHEYAMLMLQNTLFAISWSRIDVTRGGGERNEWDRGPERRDGRAGGRQPPRLHVAHAALRAPALSASGQLLPAQRAELPGVCHGL